MLGDLKKLLDCVCEANAGRKIYQRAIQEENCLVKRSLKTRQLSYGHLASLYGLEPGLAIFRALRYFWTRDSAARPLLALACACARDSLLRSTAAFVLAKPQDTLLTTEEMAGFIERRNPGRFSKATLNSTAQNINSTWTQSGHLKGRSRKFRAPPKTSAANAAYCLYLAWLSGERGKSLFQSGYMQLLDCPLDRRLELAASASAQGWLTMNRIGDIIDVQFSRSFGQVKP